MCMSSKEEVGQCKQSHRNRPGVGYRLRHIHEEAHIPLHPHRCGISACIMLVMMSAMYRSLVEEQREQLKNKLAIVANGVEEGGIDWLENLTVKGYRMTLVSSEGVVLHDSEADSATMENHLERQEIADALQSGSGESERISSTMIEKTFYQAKRLENGNILRISFTKTVFFGSFAHVDAPFLSFCCRHHAFSIPG